tara:strand:+ start:691 stop:981 length:291 start_codon:yes stop_codon:yes gene_type:complete
MRMICAVLLPFPDFFLSFKAVYSRSRLFTRAQGCLLGLKAVYSGSRLFPAKAVGLIDWGDWRRGCWCWQGEFLGPGIAALFQWPVEPFALPLFFFV